MDLLSLFTERVVGAISTNIRRAARDELEDACKDSMKEPLDELQSKKLLVNKDFVMSHFEFAVSCLCFAHKRKTSAKLTASQWNKLLPVSRYHNESASDELLAYEDFREAHLLKAQRCVFHKSVGSFALHGIAERLMNAYEVLYDEYSQDHDDDPPSAPEFKGEPNRAPITGGVVFGPWLPPKEAKSQDDSLAEQLRETKKKLVVTQIRLQMEMELSETLHSKLQRDMDSSIVTTCSRGKSSGKFTRDDQVRMKSDGIAMDS